MHTFLIRALHRGSGSPQPIFACVARGSVDAAEGLVLGELHRAGWKVLEVVEPSVVRSRFPALKRHPAVAQVLAVARQRGLAFLVLEGDIGA
ncbi:MAG: hypothetical protein H6Q00_3158 [Holophagaceae bacterium]|nr:hypothetical protein [Holophagaceae bacterium]